MSIQPPLPGVVWPRNASWPDAEDRLKRFERDKLEAKFEIRQVLDKYADRYGVRPKDVNRRLYGSQTHHH